MISFLDGLRDGLRSGLGNGEIASRANTSARRLARMSLFGLAGVSLSFGASAAIAQPIVQPVSKIPVPAPQSRSAGAASGVEASLAELTQTELGQFPMGRGADVLTGEPLAMPEDRVPVGSWSGRAGVKDVATAELPWMGVGGYAAAVPSSQAWAQPWMQAPLQAQYRVVVATPSAGHAEALKQVVPTAIALQASPGIALSNRSMMQAGAFVDWRRANALRRALQAYGFLAEVQGI